MSLLNALGEHDDPRRQTKLLETLFQKWMVEQRASGPNESIFCITLLSEYDMVGIILLRISLSRYFSFTVRTGAKYRAQFAKY